MSDGPLAFCFGVHNHQPIGNFDTVVEEATDRAYRPFLERLRARPEVRLTVHCTGSLLEWLRERASGTFDLLGELTARRQIELLTGGFYEPILAVLPDADKVGQIERLSDYVKAAFGVRPRGMWLAERVWEPQLPRALHAAGVEYVLLDDSHFALAGLDPEAIGGYYLTEEQGAVVGVFPISQRLRYLIPFAAVQESLDYLGERRGATPVLTVMDDGEKFGAWPGTHAHVYESGWLDEFFDRVLATPWLAMTTFADVVDRIPAADRVYLPTASYREMGEWALPASLGDALGEAKREIASLAGGERLTSWLRGGFWRAFLVKYPEVADMYWKMLRLSAALHRERSRGREESRLDRALTALWRGQANDAYWHGVFGGCYLPHLRRAVKGALLEAERLLAESTGAAPAVWHGDGNGDGREEVYVRTPALSVTLNPALGGGLTELAFLPLALDVADVLARRPEAYHEQLRRPRDAAATTITAAEAPIDGALHGLLDYDPFRRASLLDGIFDELGTIDPVAPWRAARRALGAQRYRCTVDATDVGAVIRMALLDEHGGDGVAKHVHVGEASVTATYRVRLGQSGRWGVQWNLALTAGDASDRYLVVGGEPTDEDERLPLQSTGRRVTGGVTLVDEWIGVEARLRWAPDAELAWGPVQTVSVSEAGFERIYQGTALLLLWPLAVGDERELRISMTLASR